MNNTAQNLITIADYFNQFQEFQLGIVDMSIHVKNIFQMTNVKQWFKTFLLFSSS